MNTIFCWALGTWEVLIIMFVIVLLFGGRKIPELMKGIGKGIKSFKQGMREVEDEIRMDDDEHKAGK